MKLGAQWGRFRIVVHELDAAIWRLEVNHPDNLDDAAWIEKDLDRDDWAYQALEALASMLQKGEIKLERTRKSYGE